MPNPLATQIRRSWLRGTLSSIVLFAASTRAADPLDSIRAKGREAGLGPFEALDSANFRGIGDAHPKFQAQALDVCEAVLTDYRQHFKAKGFELDWPKDRLTVVILESPQSYAAFEKCFVDEAIGGHFDLDANRLVMFDARSRDPKAKVGALVPELDNTLALVHETIHQLTFNTGVLDLKAAVPLAISEGLATYGETWRPNRQGRVGEVNRRRRKGLDDARKAGTKWIPLPTLLADDKPFDPEKSDRDTVQMAYAEAWMFASKMLKESAFLPKFRGYLAALKGKNDPSKRVELASTHLGDLDRIDRALRPPGRA